LNILNRGAPCPEICEWSPWIDVSRPLYGPDSGDYETYENIRAHGIEVCTNPLNISCRAVKYPALSFQELGQKVKCDVSIGLVCENRDQVPGPVMPDSVCLNYEVNIYCSSCIACYWSEWIDVSNPRYEGGDYETYENIREKGIDIAIPCPSNKVYKACGPSEEKTCKSGSLTGSNGTQVEGCFCPEGTILYDAGVDVCVKTCGCVGPDNIPRKFGDTFEFDCKDRVCLEGGSGIICENHKCPPAQDDPQCEGEGFHKISGVNPDDKCCSKTTCAPKGVCVHNGAEYKPGSKVLGDECQNCVCTHEWNNSTTLKVIDCDHIPCSVTCEEVSTRQASFRQSL
ncbi:UNVERIFIED_CONTAM: hypothetical protein K2H54_065949, partial [Gekko kuhli]